MPTPATLLFKICFLVLTFLLLNHSVFAQCPVANSCTPGNAPSSSFPFGMGIYNVTVGSGANGISNPTTGGASAGYQDYSCTQKATVLKGVNTSISVTTNPNANENVRVWLDLNNNGIFDNTTELIFSSVNAKVHTGSFTIPVSASVVKNTVLRLRVSADNFSSALPTPCSTPAYSQVEDYGLMVVSNTNKPAVAFSVNNPVTCSPTVQFQNLTQNGAISYLWNFGDGTTSTTANPSHTYAAAGNYTVKLKACNANGCDSLTQTNYVTYHTNVPIAASCTPTTTGYCCGYGITNFSLGTLTNASADGAVGYEDFTCTKSITLQENATYPVSIMATTSTPQDFWIYIDYNNDGSFTANELTYSKPAAVNPTDNLVIKGGGMLHTRLRMRVIADATGNSSNACADRSFGQVEDYTVVILPNTNKPFVNFTSNRTSACDSVVQFTDLSQNLPSTWVWEFGDGSPRSFKQNPTHVYSKSGLYTIKLLTCNDNGCDTLSKKNFVVVTKPCPTYCIPTNFNNSNYITNVTLADLNHSSGREYSTYGDYTNFVATVVKGNPYPINVSLSSYPGIWYSAYVDYNQDGDFFDKGEFATSGRVPGAFSGTITIPITAKTGLTRIRVISSPFSLYPCVSNANVTEVEDYSLNILPNNLPPTAAFFTNGTKSCSYTISFNDTSANSPTSWLWNFGDPASGASNTSTLPNPTHKFSGAGTYTISLTAKNSFGTHTTTKTAYVTVTGNNGPRSANCIQSTLFTDADYGNGIAKVMLDSINHTSLINDNYQDYSCTQPATLRIGEDNLITILTGVRNNVENVRAWIDYNNDGDFNPISELAFSSDTNKIHQGNIIPPLSAVPNKFLRMRIASEAIDRLPPSPCNPIQYGQAEDYAVKIYDPNRPEEPDPQGLKIYPNPNNGTFYLKIPSVFKNHFQLEVHNLIGQKVAEREVKNAEPKTQIDLSYLPKGVYLLRIFNAENAAVKKIVIH